MNDFYVYAWLKPSGAPFYIGKGTGKRAWAYKRQNPVFAKIVNKIESTGEKPSVVILRDGLAEDDAFAIESELIRSLGRRNNGTGILANLTDGGGGTSGKVVTDETRARMSASLTGKAIPESTRRGVARANAARTWGDCDRERMSISLCSKPPLAGYKGVTFYRRTGKWMAQITLHGKYRCIGYFPTAEEAARAYDKAAFAAWGSDCYLNFPADIAA